MKSYIKLCIGMALCGSEPKQPPRLGNVYRHILAAAVRSAERDLRMGVALCCDELKQSRPARHHGAREALLPTGVKNGRYGTE